MIQSISRGFDFFVNSIRQSSLSFQWRLVYSDPVFADDFWFGNDVVFTNAFMHQRWLYFLFWFQASTVNWFSLSIPYVSYHSIFNDDFSVYSDSVFNYDFLVYSNSVFNADFCISSDVVFTHDFKPQRWLYFCCWFQVSTMN